MSSKKSRKSGKQMLHELPVAHLTEAKRRELLIELIECFRQGWDANARDSEVYRDACQTFYKYDVDVHPDTV